MNLELHNKIWIPNLLAAFKNSLLILLVISFATVKAQKFPKISYIGDTLEVKEETMGLKTKFFSNGHLHIISSSHQDIGWENTPMWCSQYRADEVIIPALKLLEQDPTYHYSIESALSFYEIMEKYPELRGDIERFLNEGRLEWGATFNQPYEGLYNDEALVRQLYLGKRFMEKEFPKASFDVAWNPDVPSRVRQMPQILSKAGVNGLIFSRFRSGVFQWKSPDGSSIMALSAGQYTHADWMIKDVSEGYKNPKPFKVPQLKENLEYMLPSTAEIYKNNKFNPQLGIISSKDMMVPLDYGSLITDWNPYADGNNYPSLKYSTLSKFEKSIFKKSSKPEVLKGDWPNLWLYIHGPTHHKSVTKGRAAHKLLPIAEQLALVDAKLKGNFNEYPEKEFKTAWFDAIYPDHGWGGKNGAITDSIFGAKFGNAEKMAQDIIQNSLEGIYSQVDFQDEGIPVLVYNPTQAQRTSLADVDINFFNYADKVNNNLMAFDLFDNQGNAIPYQIGKGSAYDEGMRITFQAENVPGNGYKTFYLKQTNDWKSSSTNAITTENDFYKLTFTKGGVAQIFDKQLGKNILNTDKFLGGELLLLKSEGNGAGEFTSIQQPSTEIFETSSKTQSHWNCVANGPVKSTWETNAFMNGSTVRLMVSMHHKIKKIDFEYYLEGFNGKEDVEFRAAFPMAFKGGDVKYDTPMAIATAGKTELKGTAGKSHSKLIYPDPISSLHPREVLDWFAYTDAENTVVIKSDVSVFDWIDPTEQAVDYAVLQPILMASRVSCNGKGNRYLQPGDHYFQFSLTSDKTASLNLNQTVTERFEPFVSYADIHYTKTEGTLKDENSFFNIETSPDVKLTTIKKGEDDNSVIVRVCNYSDNPSSFTIKSFFDVPIMTKVNILEMEDENEAKALTQIGAYSIETVKLK